MWGHPYRRQLKGCRVFPAGVWGVPKFFFSSLAAAGGEQKEKKRFFGDTPNPAKGLAPLGTPPEIVKLTPKGDTPNPAKGLAPLGTPLIPDFATALSLNAQTRLNMGGS